MLRAELDDDYFTTIRYHLRQLKFQDGVLISGLLGEGNKGVGYVVRKEKVPEGGWMERLFSVRPPACSFQIHERDESGSRALGELRDRGINLVANALAQSVEHIVGFFTMLRTELAFYVGCLNLYGQLCAQDAPVCYPQPTAPHERVLSATGLYDVCLALKLAHRVVGNELAADEKGFVIITGANQGGKSTFLRSVGLSHAMMQCGMFVPAESFRANVCERIFTHYKREEDPTMESGKFDEELSRMSDIIDHIVPDSLVLFNESFAATNEREGSEIARQIVTALIERRIKVFFVTHQYEFARGLYARQLSDGLFLRAERQADGIRTFKIAQGQPLETSFGEDLYKAIFLAGETR
jgi:DNA mismatch repair ATPase MutS